MKLNLSIFLFSILSLVCLDAKAYAEQGTIIKYTNAVAPEYKVNFATSDDNPSTNFKANATTGEQASSSNTSAGGTINFPNGKKQEVAETPTSREDKEGKIYAVGEDGKVTKAAEKNKATESLADNMSTRAKTTTEGTVSFTSYKEFSWTEAIVSAGICGAAMLPSFMAPETSKKMIVGLAALGGSATGFSTETGKQYELTYKRVEEKQKTNSPNFIDVVREIDWQPVIVNSATTGIITGGITWLLTSPKYINLVNKIKTKLAITNIIEGKQKIIDYLEKRVGKTAGDDITSIFLRNGEDFTILTNARKLPGTSIGNGKNITGIWLRGTEQNAGLFPKTVADKLRGKYFKNFDDFRQQFWKEVANEPNLANQFTPQNVSRMKNDNAPIAVPKQWLGGQQSYILHHKTPINQGGSVYDVDNLYIVTPKYHKEILDPAYHCGYGY